MASTSIISFLRIIRFVEPKPGNQSCPQQKHSDDSRGVSWQGPFFPALMTKKSTYTEVEEPSVQPMDICAADNFQNIHFYRHTGDSSREVGLQIGESYELGSDFTYFLNLNSFVSHIIYVWHSNCFSFPPVWDSIDLLGPNLESTICCK